MDEPDEKIIDVFICKLRKKLAKASGGKNYIETVWGRGTRSVSRISRGSRVNLAERPGCDVTGLSLKRSGSFVQT